jgi:transposase
MVEVEKGVGLVELPRRRRRSAAERRLIVEETLEAGTSVARVAQKYGINANQLFQWRRLYRDGHLGVPSQSGMKLLPVSVIEEAAAVKTPAMLFLF